MTELKTLESVLETTREGIFLARVNTPAANADSNEHPLFFPRKKLRMTKVYSGNWEPHSWFIQDRLNERATHLKHPTQNSREGLTSGFRSAIVKNPDNTYTKLKGVSLKPTIREESGKNLLTKTVTNIKGLCGPSEAYKELTTLSLLNCMGSDLIAPIIPDFIEIYRFYNNTPKLKDFLQEFNKPQIKIKYKEIQEGKFKKLIKELAEVGRELKKHSYGKNDYFVSGVKIKADTRLDEAIYNLTKKPLAPGLAEKRDETLTYLFFRAGIMHGMLNTHGYSWSYDLINSNAHLGNFLLHSRKGALDAGICDLGSATHIDEYPDADKFYRFAMQEVDDFQYELDKTSGLTVQKSYRFFPNKLKQDCLDAFKTGYAIIIMDEQKRTGDLLMHYSPSRIVAPKNAVIPVEEFKDFLKELKVA